MRLQLLYLIPLLTACGHGESNPTPATPPHSVNPPSAPPPVAESPPTHRPKFEVARVDDSLDPFKNLDDASIPSGEGIAIFGEQAPLGLSKPWPTHFARIIYRAGEDAETGGARFRKWLGTITLPRGARFALGEAVEYEPDSQSFRVVGARSFTLVGEPILRTEDVVAASMVEASSEAPVHLDVTVGPKAAARFEAATRAWTERRLAILIDDRVTSAPIVKEAIGGGHLSVAPGEAPPARQTAELRRLEQAFRLR